MSLIFWSPRNLWAVVCRLPPSPAALKSWTLPAPAVLAEHLRAIRSRARRRLAVLDLFEQENLLARANELGDRFQRRAREWQRRWPIIGDVRGLGGMQAIELVQSQETKTPAADETKQITQYCYEHGLITITAGSYSNVIRILVPLVATNEQIDEGLDVLESAIATVCDKKGAVAQLV